MDTTGSKPKRGRGRGRPPLPKSVGKRHAIGLRVTADLRHSLEATATASGRSLSQEAEFRLEQSFRGDDAYGGRELAGLFRMMAGATQMIEERQGKKWSEDYETFIAVHSAWQELLKGVAPNLPDAASQDLNALDPDQLPAEPQPPSKPEPAGPMGQLGRHHTPEQEAQIAEAQAKYERDFAAYRELLEERVQRAQRMVDRHSVLKALGRRTAGKLIAPRGESNPSTQWHSDW